MTSTPQPLVETVGALVTRDGIPVAVTKDPFAWLLRHQGQSTAYALAHGGYAIHEDDADIRGGMAFLAIATDTAAAPFAWDRFAVRTLIECDRLADAGDLWPDYIGGDDVLFPMLSALIGGLQYLGGRGSALDSIRGMLDGAARSIARRAGATQAEADAL